MFIDNLIKLSRGEPVDFIIWNCFGFRYFQQNFEYPYAQLINNLDTAIVGYFSQRIEEMAKILSKIGKVNIIILVPTNEAYGDRVNIWNFKQSIEEREQVIEDSINRLTDIARAIPTPIPATIQIRRWDKYLITRMIKNPQEYYSDRGIFAIESADDYQLLRENASRHAQLYFQQYSLVVQQNKETTDRQLRYLGMYTGEGLAYRDLIDIGINIVIVNFEEGRVPTFNFRGAGGEVPIVTPAKPNEISAYYIWKKQIIAERRYEK
ncbi:hypothetical protein A2154_00320 [Candidatus Gottesmanbacteria bacterium RBG_16_43_7]|uniref:Uncharacterized protein n=1 Tax=Candidatus Gottesmanbacteria bacterium RBG_16_43_7 TaxID=1798373 RepID=A0A1F5Z8B7_9BACT|nr:MAG: hypothetical protein A2154_00320 [Candidatus Gottesmanbacteria bacterium RBG_16_43_7]